MKKNQSLSFLGFPPLLWFVFFLLLPLGLVVITSLMTRGTYGNLVWSFSGQSYLRVFDLRYLDILFKSLKLAGLTTIMCLTLGYPIAWAIATSPQKWKNRFLVLVAIPFFMNLVIRIFSLRLLFGFEGPVAKVLEALSITHDPYALSQNQILVFYGMIVTYLPYMVFPLYGALEKFDFNMVEACVDLGGNSWDVFSKVLWPNTKAAVASGALLVFVPSLGEFVIPDLLGGAKNMLIGNLITEQFLKSRDWPFGAALSVALMLLLTVLSYVIYSWGNKKAWKN